jgi:excisionase family DNA binding protein
MWSGWLAMRGKGGVPMNKSTGLISITTSADDDRFTHAEGFEVVDNPSSWPLWLTVAMVAKRLSLGKTKVYEMIDMAGLPAVRVGRAVRVPTARFLKWVEEFEKQGLSA